MSATAKTQTKTLSILSASEKRSRIPTSMNVSVTCGAPLRVSFGRRTLGGKPHLPDWVTMERDGFRDREE